MTDGLALVWWTSARRGKFALPCRSAQPGHLGQHQLRVGQDVAADDEALDLRGALIDLVNLGVAVRERGAVRCVSRRGAGQVCTHRISFSMPYSTLYPLPPKICTASVVTFWQCSEAKALAMEAT